MPRPEPKHSSVEVLAAYSHGWPLAGLYGNNPLMRARLVLKGSKNSIGLTDPVLK